MSSGKDTQGKILIGSSKASEPQSLSPTPIYPSYPSPPNSPLQPNAESSGACQDCKDGPCSSILCTPPSSPTSNRSKPELEYHNVAKKDSQISGSTLKAMLGLDDWRCGSLTRKGTPCKIKIHDANKDQINSLVASMICFAHTSSNLRRDLEKLALLTLCRHHDGLGQKASRIDTWTQVFPLGNDNVKPTMSVEERIKGALPEGGRTCIGMTLEAKRCRWKLGGRNVQNKKNIIRGILNPEVYSDCTHLDCFLQELGQHTFCDRHKEKQRAKQVAKWKSDIVEICKEMNLVLAPSKQDKASSHLENRSLSPGNSVVEKASQEELHGLNTQSPLTPASSSSHFLSRERNRNPAAFLLYTFDITPFNIIARGGQLNQSWPSPQDVCDEIAEALNSGHQGIGHVYAFEVEGNAGFVKIGYTCRPIEDRYKEWANDCNRAPKPLYPMPLDSAITVPNPRFVEALCHAELRHRRIRIDCNACSKQHNEWFEVSPVEAIAVIEKWSCWMFKVADQSNIWKLSVTRTLGEDEKYRAKDIDKFLEELIQM
ncbi:hypothetical protein BBP40_006701 [Aspergillus hancockii]|nr:hypothetical protein BBP40_006701 [Aspergillus hancockii]